MCISEHMQSQDKASQGVAMYMSRTLYSSVSTLGFSCTQKPIPLGRGGWPKRSTMLRHMLKTLSSARPKNLILFHAALFVALSAALLSMSSVSGLLTKGTLSVGIWVAG